MFGLISEKVLLVECGVTCLARNTSVADEVDCQESSIGAPRGERIDALETLNRDSFFVAWNLRSNECETNPKSEWLGDAEIVKRGTLKGAILRCRCLGAQDR